MRASSIEKTLLWAVKIGLWAIPLLPLYVSSSMLFPFITGKNFSFRIIVEIIFALWLGLMAIYPQYRPRLSWIVKLATILITVLFLADLFSPNPYRAFFSNYERMEGFMMLFHMYLYFLMLVSVFRRRDWLVFFHVTVAASIYVAFVGLLQKFGYRISLQGGFRVDSTIGNPTYFAAYLSFHVWILFLLLKRFWRAWGLRILYAALLFFELLLIYFSATRGAMVAFVAVAPLAILAVILLWPRMFSSIPQYRKWAAALLIIFILTPVVFWLLRGASFIQGNQILNRFTSISFDDRTTRSRFSIWNMSWRGFTDRPLLGWGQENFYLVFQKYYDPKLYDSEPWFDRAHNIVFDRLIDTGIAGFLAFFALLGSAFYLLWRGIRERLLDPWTGIILASAFAAYLIQNIFVFDNFVTYLLFFSFLAYTDYATGRPAEDTPQFSLISSSSITRGMVLAAGALAAVAVLGYAFHYKAIKEAKALIVTLQMAQGGAPVNILLPQFQRVLSYNTFGDTEVREQAANIARRISSDENISREERAQFVAFAAEELRKETDRPAKDIKHLIFLASVLSAGADLDSRYAVEAEQLLREALRLSPAKQIIHFELAQLYLRLGRIEDALRIMQVALELEPDYQVARANLIVTAAVAGRRDVMEKYSGDLNVAVLNEDNLMRLGVAFRNAGMPEPAIRVYARLAQVVPQSPRYHATLAALLAEAGDIQGAIEEAGRAAELDPQFAQEAEIFIQQIQK